MKIVSNCPHCEEHYLHVMDSTADKFMQCLYCGYATSDKFKIDGSLDDNLEYTKLTEEMKSFAKIKDKKFWIPGIMTLPTAMIYPTRDDEDTELKWAHVKMIDIPKDEQESYPDPSGGYYKKRYDMENSVIYDEFYIALSMFNAGVVEPVGDPKLELPKLTKSNG
jgi:hypothetical protein